MGAADVCRVGDDISDGRINRGLDGQVLCVQVDERDFHSLIFLSLADIFSDSA
jgi:hypothetical protein